MSRLEHEKELHEKELEKEQDQEHAAEVKGMSHGPSITVANLPVSIPTPQCCFSFTIANLCHYIILCDFKVFNTV